jgi:YidC/Oxa1 family membrane protein insertase
MGVVMEPLFYAVSAILLGWHWLFTLVGVSSDGWIWVLSIAGLTVTIRALLIPLFVKQIKSSRNMQLLQPQIKELQKKYGHDRQKLAEEQMKLWKETGTNPFASCLPLLLQMPIFFALFNVINNAAKGNPRGLLDAADAASLKQAVFLGGRIADTFMNSAHLETKIIAMFMVVAMCVTQFITQRQLMAKNMPPDALTGPYAQQQKILLYMLPIVFAVSGVAFPIGVLIYWTVSNLWTMGQQFYVIRRNPAPGTPAFHAKQVRDAKRGRAVQEDPLEELEHPHPNPPARQQPQNQSRNQRKKKSKKNKKKKGGAS